MEICLLLIYYIEEKYFLVIAFFALSFFIRIMWQNGIILCGESYPTNVRSVGNGAFFALAGVVGAVTPFIVYIFYHFDPYSPFLLGFGVLLPALYASYTFPFDPTNKPLDRVE